MHEVFGLKLYHGLNTCSKVYSHLEEPIFPKTFFLLARAFVLCLWLKLFSDSVDRSLDIRIYAHPENTFVTINFPQYSAWCLCMPYSPQTEQYRFVDLPSDSVRYSSIEAWR